MPGNSLSTWATITSTERSDFTFSPRDFSSGVSADHQRGDKEAGWGAVHVPPSPLYLWQPLNGRAPDN